MRRVTWAVAAHVIIVADECAFGGAREIKAALISTLSAGTLLRVACKDVAIGPCSACYNNMLSPQWGPRRERSG